MVTFSGSLSQPWMLTAYCLGRGLGRGVFWLRIRLVLCLSEENGGAFIPIHSESNVITFKGATPPRVRLKENTLALTGAGHSGILDDRGVYTNLAYGPLSTRA